MGVVIASFLASAFILGFIIVVGYLEILPEGAEILTGVIAVIIVYRFLVILEVIK